MKGSGHDSTKLIFWIEFSDGTHASAFVSAAFARGFVRVWNRRKTRLEPKARVAYRRQTKTWPSLPPAASSRPLFEKATQ
jgi:hypothetical protein